jgi:hypothetical protein
MTWINIWCQYVWRVCGGGPGSRFSVHSKCVDVFSSMINPLWMDETMSRILVESTAAKLAVGQGTYHQGGRLVDDILRRGRINIIHYSCLWMNCVDGCKSADLFVRGPDSHWHIVHESFCMCLTSHVGLTCSLFLIWMPSKVCGHFEFHKQFWPLDRIGELSIQLAVSSREDCHLKSHNHSWNVKVMRHQNEDDIVPKVIT